MEDVNERLNPTCPRASLWQSFSSCCRRRRSKRIQALEQRANELDTALMQATVNGDLYRVQRLVQQGANRHVQHASAMLESHVVSYDRQAFDTPLEAAAWLGHDDIVQYFLRQEQLLQQRSSRLLLFSRNSRRNDVQKESSSSPSSSSSSSDYSSLQVALDREAFLVACQGGTLETVQCFVETFGPQIVTQRYPNVVTPLHHACARCHIPLMQYLVQHGARLDVSTNTINNDNNARRRQGRATAPIQWLGLYVEMKGMHRDNHGTSPIPLPENDALTEESYEAAMTWIIQNHSQALLVTDHRGTTALERLLKRAPLGLVRTSVVQLVAGATRPSAKDQSSTCKAS